MTALEFLIFWLAVLFAGSGRLEADPFSLSGKEDVESQNKESVESLADPFAGLEKGSLRISSFLKVPIFEFTFKPKGKIEEDDDSKKVSFSPNSHVILGGQVAYDLFSLALSAPLPESEESIQKKGRTRGSHLDFSYSAEYWSLDLLWAKLRGLYREKPGDSSTAAEIHADMEYGVKGFILGWLPLGRSRHLSSYFERDEVNQIKMGFYFSPLAQLSYEEILISDSQGLLRSTALEDSSQGLNKIVIRHLGLGAGGYGVFQGRSVAGFFGLTLGGSAGQVRSGYLAQADENSPLSSDLQVTARLGAKYFKDAWEYGFEFLINDSQFRFKKYDLENESGQVVFSLAYNLNLDPYIGQDSQM